MPYTTLVAGTTITSAWANANVRDQVVTPFATAAARTSAVTSPPTGLVSYRIDGPLLEAYDGANHVPIGRFTQFARKTADETVNNSAAFQNDDHLSLALAANAAYLFEQVLMYQSNSTADLKYEFTGPAGFAMNYGGIYVEPSSGAITIPAGITAVGTLAMGGIGSNAFSWFSGILTTSGTAGTLQFRWAQNTANASDTILRTGSYIMLTRTA